MQLLGEPLFYEPLAVAIDKSSELDQTALVEAVAGIVEEMHADGTLTELSMEWYGEDLTVEPRADARAREEDGGAVATHEMGAGATRPPATAPPRPHGGHRRRRARGSRSG